MPSKLDFQQAFNALTGNEPFPWQRELYDAWFSLGKTPLSCSLPTGLGKTSVVAVWLIALANGASLPRRLVYVVNRRTVVDQTTDEAMRLQKNLAASGLESPLRKLCALELPENKSPLAISTLRGKFADNREWSTDPCRPAIISGTVDMIGSRLLFSGYGVGFRSKPLHAGFLGQDSFLIHDEAHLEPAFQALVESIRSEQQRCREFARFHVMELSATTRSGDAEDKSVFTLTPADRTHPVVRNRIEATKRLTLTPVENDKQTADKIAGIAEEHKNANAAVLVFVRTLDAVAVVEKELRKTQRRVVLLTGTMRGKERDELVDSPEFKRFLKGADPGETVYLVCTSAGEVGVDISADHMVCDLSTLESMVQRFGRVNRYGKRDDSRIDVVHPIAFDDKDKLASARQATLELLIRLDRDASPQSVGSLMSSLSDQERKSCFAPAPTILSVTDILFDAWALTSIKDKMPGRPIVEPYIHGIRDYEPFETQVAWRDEVERVAGDLLDAYPPQDLLADYPLKPQEVLRDRSDRVFKQLELLANRRAHAPVWIVDEAGAVDVASLGEVTDKQQKDRINGCTILLPPSVGGLARGMLDGTEEGADDVADVLDGPNQRIRVHFEDSNYAEKMVRAAAMRRVRSIELAEDNDESEEPRRWEWFESLPLEGGRTAKKPVLLTTHVEGVTSNTRQIVAGLSLPPEIAEAIILAAELHDHGKRRERFQLTLGNRSYPELCWAKSGHHGARLPEPFRHEFASLLDAQADARFGQLSAEMQDVVLHLIATHHGRARPHFGLEEAFDPERPSADAEALASETPRRFARLQRTFGRWGLAYLESTLRAADWAASAAPIAYADEPEDH